MLLWGSDHCHLGNLGVSCLDLWVLQWWWYLHMAPCDAEELSSSTQHRPSDRRLWQGKTRARSPGTWQEETGRGQVCTVSPEAASSYLEVGSCSDGPEPSHPGE